MQLEKKIVENTQIICTTLAMSVNEKLEYLNLGDIDYFLEQHKIENLREAEKRTVVKVAKETSKKDSNQLSRDQEKELKKLNNKLSKIETEIADLEREIAKIDLELAENYEEVSSRPNFFEKYKAKKIQLDIVMEAWEKMEAKVSNFS